MEPSFSRTGLAGKICGGFLSLLWPGQWGGLERVGACYDVQGKNLISGNVVIELGKMLRNY